MHAYLFVYGTLRRALGHPMGRLLDDATCLGEGSVAGRLYDLGAYPGLIRARSARDRVRGEVYRLPQPKLLLQRLDAYEGCRRRDQVPDEYRRQTTRVRLDDGRIITAWVYVFNGATSARGCVVSGDYVRHRRNAVRQP